MKKPQNIKRKKKTKNKKQKPIINLIRIFLWSVVAFGVLILVFSETEKNKERVSENPSISKIAESIKNGEIEKIIVKGVDVNIIYKDTTDIVVRRSASSDFDETLSRFGVTPELISSIDYRVEKETGFAHWVKLILPFLFPIFILLVFIWFITKQAKGVGMQAFNFGKSKARFISPDDKEKRITFADVAGAEEAKEELVEFVDFLKAPEKYFAIGAKIPKGIILTGSPGTGKTLLARAVSGEASVPFFSIAGSEFVEMFVGVGAARVRDLFAVAKKHSPSIIFIDEIDAVGRTRGGGTGGGNDEREQALNQILVEMDGFEQKDKVIVIAATNRADVLDRALLRPGRFDRKVVVINPDIKGRKEILKVHSKGKKFEEGVDLGIIARRTPGLSGADLESIINEAAILAVRKKREKVSQQDLLSSIEKVLMGPERKSSIITPEEKKVIAYHEAGHALLGSVLSYSDPVQKITIVPRGVAGGYVLSLPDKERNIKTKQEYIDEITMALGGYVAEELVFGDISTGPSSDLDTVSDIALSMVTKWGMTKSIGPLVLRRSQFVGFGSGREVHSEEMEKLIDKEVNKIINDCYKNAKKILKSHRKAMDVLVAKLFEVETLEREEYEKLLKENGVVIKNHHDIHHKE